VPPWQRPVHSSTQGTAADPSPNRVRGCRGPICYPSAIGAAGPLRGSAPPQIVTAIRAEQIEGGGDGNQGLKRLIGLHYKLELDPPPLKWSTLRYAFGHERETANAEEALQAGRDRRGVETGRIIRGQRASSRVPSFRLFLVVPAKSSRLGPPLLSFTEAAGS
jgi:hypothetical protein